MILSDTGYFVIINKIVISIEFQHKKKFPIPLIICNKKNPIPQSSADDRLQARTVQKRQDKKAGHAFL